MFRGALAKIRGPNGSDSEFKRWLDTFCTRGMLPCLDATGCLSSKNATQDFAATASRFRMLEHYALWVGRIHARKTSQNAKLTVGISADAWQISITAPSECVFGVDSCDQRVRAEQLERASKRGFRL